MKVDISVEQILAAADTSEQAEKALKQLFPKVFPIYHIGQRFSKSGNYSLDSTYILAQVYKNTVLLINLSTGESPFNYVQVQDVQNITYKEFKELTMGNKFILNE